MYIREKRIKDEVDRIIKENLMDGQLPTSKEVLAELSAYIATNNLNVPSYKFYKVYIEFTIDLLNKAQQDITKDLSLIYESILDLCQLGDKQIERFEWERKKHTYTLSKLESQFMDLALIENSSIYKEIFTDTFVDRNNVDEASSCDVNIEHGEVVLKRLQDELFLGEKQVKVTYPNESDDVSITQNGKLSDAIDIKGINWKSTIRKATEGDTSVLITISLDKVEDLNRMVIYAPLLKNSKMKIRTSKDIDEWIDYGTFDLQERANISFLHSFKVITLELSKVEADKYKDNMFEYIFLVDTIELFKTNYAKKSTLLSNVIEFDNNVDKVYLEVDKFTPPGTSISHFIALKENNPEWIQIEPGVPISFNTISEDNEKVIALSQEISDKEYELAHLETYGQKVYSITPRGLSENNITYNNLYKGIDSWREDIIQVSAFGAPKISLFNKAKEATKYVPIMKERSGLILSARVFDSSKVVKYSTTIERKEISQAIKANVVSSHPVSIYLNGQRIFSDDRSNTIIDQPVIYYFRKGQNILDVIININKANEAETAVASIDLQLDLYGLSKFIYAEPKAMREVSLFNLRYNSNNQNDVYAITDTNSGQEIVVKNNDLSIKYLLKYDYITNKQTEVLFKSVLTREYISINISPRLISYSLKII